MAPVLHQVWVGSPLPPLFERYAEGWRERHPGWSYILWTDCPDGFDVEPLFRKAGDYVPSRNIGQFRADVLRYELLYRFGGAYVDTDMEPQHPIDICTGLACWAAWEKTNVWVNNAVMGAEAGAPFLRRVLDALPESVRRNKGKRPNISTGPQFLTRLYRENPSELWLYPQEWFYPYSWDELDRADESFPDALCIHRWGNKSGVGRGNG